jgi:dynein heavy chain 1
MFETGSFSENKLINFVDKASRFEKVKPYILLCDKGFDVSHRVEALAGLKSKRVISVAMGSNESNKLADAAISEGIKRDEWVLIKNAHLSFSWLISLEKRISSIPSGRFIFISMEINSKIPVNLLRASRLMMFEPPLGIKSNIIQSLQSISHEISSSGPSEKYRIIFALSWLHGVILERSRYIPLGWTKNYDFNDSDFEMSLNLLNSLLSKCSNGKSNIPPESIPWEAICSLISQNVYGGKIDRSCDQNTLNALVKGIFNIEIFNNQFCLVSGNTKHSAICIPDVVNLKDFNAWCEQLEDFQPPSWIGLPFEADSILKKQKGITYNSLSSITAI